MELLAGGTLKDRVERTGAMDPAEAVDAMLQVIAGLDAAHQAGVPHRDVTSPRSGPAGWSRGGPGSLKDMPPIFRIHEANRGSHYGRRTTRLTSPTRTSLPSTGPGTVSVMARYSVWQWVRPSAPPSWLRTYPRKARVLTVGWGSLTIVGNPVSPRQSS